MPTTIQLFNLSQTTKSTAFLIENSLCRGYGRLAPVAVVVTMDKFPADPSDNDEEIQTQRTAREWESGGGYSAILWYIFAIQLSKISTVT